MFAAAWKVLDLVTEYALPPAPGGGYWLIKQKVARALSQQDLSAWSPFTRGDAQWRAALRMYAHTMQLRHGLVHRRAEMTAGGELRIDGHGNQAGQTLAISDGEQLAFCRATQRLIDAILTGKIEPRDRYDLVFQLAEVHRHSKVAPNTKEQPRWVCEIHVNLREPSPGWVELDVAALDATMRQQESLTAFDLVAYLPNSPRAAPLVGKLEGAPLDRPLTRFRSDTPPAWLSGTRERHTLLA
jgi:hypothetical protein